MKFWTHSATTEAEVVGSIVVAAAAALCSTVAAGTPVIRRQFRAAGQSISYVSLNLLILGTVSLRVEASVLKWANQFLALRLVLCWRKMMSRT